VVGAKSFVGCFICGSKDHYARDLPKRIEAKTLTPSPAALITLCGLCVETSNPFQALSEPEVDSSNEDGPPGLEDSDSEGEMETGKSQRPEVESVALVHPLNRWSRRFEVQKKRCRRASKAVPIPGEGPAEEARSMKSFIEVTMDALNGLADDVQEWEEIEFMVDSGAGTTVISPDDAKAVKPSDPDLRRTYKLADGSMIQDKGTKTFKAQTDDEQWRLINAQVTDVDQALLSVS